MLAIRRVVEMIQCERTLMEHMEKLDWVLIEACSSIGQHSRVHMPTMQLTNSFSLIPIEVKSFLLKPPHEWLN